MKQEMLEATQKGAGWLFFGTGPITWLAQNATAITAFMSIATGLVFATCAILNRITNAQNKKINERNAASNEERNKINERDIRAKVLKEMDEELQDSLRK